jgi:hypothetical protein
MTQQIEILITPQGKASVQTVGFAGSGCQEASRFLEEALGPRLAENLTAEFHQELPAQQSQQQRA